MTGVAFEYVSREMALVSPSSIDLAKYTPIKTAAACPKDAAMSLPPNPRAAVSPISTQHPSTSGLSLGENVGMGIIANFTSRAEIEDTGVRREVAVNGCQIFEAPGVMPALPEPIFKSFEEAFLMKFSELMG